MIYGIIRSMMAVLVIVTTTAFQARTRHLRASLAAVWAARSEEQKAADHRAAYWAERAAAKQAADWLAYVEALQGAKPDAVLLAGSTLSRTLADCSQVRLLTRS